jgi:microcystin degradation protein MlrC
LVASLISRRGGRFRLEDPHSHLASMFGSEFDMGDCAVLQHADVTILLTTQKTPPFDLGQWRSQGIEPAQLRVIGAKAAVAHRRAYAPIAARLWSADTPGPCRSDLCKFPYRYIRRPIFPLDPH